ncbi:FecR domain-containing protein [Gaoshiqia sediminis]|uniref:FecR domain-containing protein n=1 Tax=Gaoshiqia sediminis TaxID=2986998 RepID=A0AA42C986_9BACT|nr:FecR domain-containing protein [Gaoshiqia sediminis]MCW0481805.1 FecR domain-containing protein [Gaoshiqia sediminis]
MEATKSIKLKIIAYLDGELDEHGMQELADWMGRSEANARYFAEVKDLWEVALRDASQQAETEKEWAKFIANTQQTEKETKRITGVNWNRVAQLAAVLVIGIFIGGILFYQATDQTPAYITASAPHGSISKIILPDQTEVFLNAGSEMKYAFDQQANQREVILDGEAWFRVARNEKKPFTVHTGTYDVRVLGTEFNVKAYSSENTVATTLEKGAVRIVSTGNLRLSSEILLNPGEQLVYNLEQKSVNVKKVDTKLYTSWKENRLEFIRMGLGDLIVLLERRYGVDILVEDKDILKYHYSGTIKNETILEILEIIQHTLPIRYEITDQTIKIFKKL